MPIFCLPERFTIAQLKSVTEAIIEKPVQRKSLMHPIGVSDPASLISAMKKFPRAAGWHSFIH